MSSITSTLRPTLVSLGLFTLLLGGAYPLATTGLLNLIAPAQASGSLIRDHKGAVIGSSLIGQTFSRPEYLWGRLSATGPAPYNAGASSGSNLGVNNPTLMDAAKARIDALKATDPTNPLPIPIDLVTASASGLDPEISPAAAAYQIARIATARHIDQDAVRDAITRSTKGRTLGILGEPRVNVLEVNLRLDGKLK